MVRKSSIKSLTALSFLSLLGFFFLSEASYAQPTSIDNGLSYLRSSQAADGSWGGTATSLNSGFQTTATVARTFQFLGVSDASLTNALGFLSAQTPNAVEDLAHQLEVLAVPGVDVTNPVALVKSSQREDGGWGLDLDKEFSSEFADTIAAFRALRTAGAANTTTVISALGYLLNTQNSDGGWGVLKDHPSEVFYTALAALVLRDLQGIFDLTAPLSAAAQFLASQQNSAGSIGDSVFETAVAFQALIRLTFDATSRDAALSYLTSSQSANGSWVDDAFSTALALRALKDAQTAAQTQIQTINLSKIVNGTPQPATIYNAFETMAISVSTVDPNTPLEIVVQDNAAMVFSTRIMEGEFFFDTLNLPPGTYTIIVRAVDEATGIVIDQQTITFTIEATVAVANALIDVNPLFTQVGATETVTVILSLANGSNATANLTIEHEVQSPSGAVLSNGVTSLPLLTETTFSRLTLSTFSHTFTESGNYPIQAKVFNGADLLTTANSFISAQADIRINPSITLNPQTVLPDGDKKIRIDIRLEGVEQQQ